MLRNSQYEYREADAGAVALFFCDRDCVQQQDNDPEARLDDIHNEELRRIEPVSQEHEDRHYIHKKDNDNEKHKDNDNSRI
jgi:hypothetical protein